MSTDLVPIQSLCHKDRFQQSGKGKTFWVESDFNMRKTILTTTQAK